MIKEAAQAIVTAIKTVPALNNRVGLRVGGTKIDPLMEKTPIPAAWVVFTGDQSLTTNLTGPKCILQNVTGFQVIVVLKNDSEQDLFDGFDTLEAIRTAVNGTTYNGIPIKYVGQTLDELVSNRIVYNQTFSITASA